MKLLPILLANEAVFGHGGHHDLDLQREVIEYYLKNEKARSDSERKAVNCNKDDLPEINDRSGF